MVVLNKIYTRTGDAGTTALGNGERVAKTDPRVAAFGAVDEANACIGLARVHTTGDEFAEVDAMLAAMQNDLFDLGADLCLPDRGDKPDHEPLRITPAQVARLEADIDHLNDALEPLRSFVLPGGHPAAAALHLARTVIRRAERRVVALAGEADEAVGEPVLVYLNRASDFLFVASRWINARGPGDVLWRPGATRSAGG